MDGNGRWARERGLPRYAGHREGVERVKEIVRAARETGIQVLTLFAFSAENWSRPRQEISILMRYLERFLDSQVKELLKNGIRLKVIGREDPLPDGVRRKLAESQRRTQDNTAMTLVLALNYGGRQEIVDAVRAWMRDAPGQAWQDFNEDILETYLYTAGLPDPDLLIRTSGEIRISNFLLWQLSYAEFYFVRKYWPDFRSSDLAEAVREFGKRKRRFGGIDVH